MMMKKTGLLAVLTAGVLLLAGCGGEAKTIDAQALAKSLATEIKYDDTLKELTADEISMLVDLPEDVDWFVAVEKRKVIGFIPVEEKKKECIINNYYVEDNNESTLKLLLEKVISNATAGKELTSVTFMEHCSLFKELGFSEEKVWTRYVKMKKDR